MKPPPELPTLFLDRNLGKHIVSARLRDAGVHVEVHDDRFAIDAPDEEWIRSVARRGWVAVTRDRNLRYRAHEMNSIREHAARVIVIRMKNASGVAMADLLIRSLPRIAQFVAATPAPFVVAITSNGALRQVWPLDFDDDEDA
ncbi:MAG: hypothetical protein OXE86_06635 [Alphaproteobacteria bacterium]|nr:hypothetical protein [Alphaproteobacteria bacterium]